MRGSFRSVGGGRREDGHLHLHLHLHLQDREELRQPQRHRRGPPLLTSYSQEGGTTKSRLASESMLSKIVPLKTIFQQ